MTGQPAFDALLAARASGRELARLVRYAELLEQWSRVHSLVKYRDREELVERHIADALAAQPLLGPRGRLLDVGSGAGLPGVPLLAVRPGWRGVLLEPRQKRWAFLRLVVRELGLDAEVADRRYQEYPNGGAGFDAITVRALGDPVALLPWARPRLASGGALLVWSTSAGEARLAGAAGWRVVSSPLAGLERGRLVQLQPSFT